MTTTMKKLVCTTLGILVTVICATFLNSSVFAETHYGSSGSDTHSGCNGVTAESYKTGTGSFNCCLFGSRCPHWILTSAKDFKEAIQNAKAQGRDYESSNKASYDACTTSDDKPVVWVGTDNNGKYVVNNDKGSASKPYKTTRFDDFRSTDHNHFEWGDELEPGKSIGDAHRDAIIMYNGEDNGDDDDIVFFCVTDQEVYARSIAHASVGGNSATADTGFGVNETATGSTEADNGSSAVNATIKFKHELKLTDGGDSSKATIKYKAKITVTATGGSRPSIAQRPGSSSWKTLKLSGSQVYTAYGGEYPATFKIDKGTEASYHICETLTYTNGSESNPREQTSTACIDISTSGTTNTISCKGSESEATPTPQYNNKHDEPEGPNGMVTPNYGTGNNGAYTRVKNATSGKMSASAPSNFVYAKPNDKIRFQHCYFPYAYKAEDENHKVIAKAKDNICRIQADATNDEDYLFKPLVSTTQSGVSSKCNDTNGKVNNQLADPIATLSPGKKYYLVEGDPKKDLGEIFWQYMEFNEDNVDYHWEDVTHWEWVCDDDDCTSRHKEYWWTHRNRRPANKSYDVGPTETDEAKVIVPYNFDTEIETDYNGDENILYPGAVFKVSVSAEVTEAKNVNRGKTYSTATPGDSKLRTVVFTLAPGVTPSGLGGTNSYTPRNNNNNGVADYVKNQLGVGEDNIKSGSEADMDGSFGDDFDITTEISAIAPDAETGTKICMVSGIWPSDSHNQPDDPKRGGEDLDSRGMRGYVSNLKWRISGVTCRTIVKNPTFQAWDGGVYSVAGISTSVNDKCVNAVLDWYRGNGCSKTTFGSWSEYEAISLGAIFKFGSGAGFGYDSGVDNSGVGGRIGGIPSNNYNNNGGLYNVSHLSIANNVSFGNPEGYNHYTGDSNIALDGAFLQRLMARYNTSTDGYGNWCSSDANSQSVIKDQVASLAPGHLIVIRYDGTCTIHHNIEVGHVPYKKIDNLPQVIIIANNINISSDVTEVDAWLIATDRNHTTSANGTINTCHQFRSPREGGFGTPSSGPCNTLLTVNGPVITGRLELNRTYGAFEGENSIEPAERFILRPDAYLWAYSQAEDLHQAFTTYTRELAPRY